MSMRNLTANRAFRWGCIFSGILTVTLYSYLAINEFLETGIFHGPILLLSDRTFFFFIILWNIMFFYGGYSYGNKYTKMYEAFTHGMTEDYIRHNHKKIDRLVRSHFIDNIKSEYTIAIGGFPIAYYIFEGRIPASIIGWSASAMCFAVGIWFYFSSRRPRKTT